MLESVSAREPLGPEGESAKAGELCSLSSQNRLPDMEGKASPAHSHPDLRADTKCISFEPPNGKVLQQNKEVAILRGSVSRSASQSE